MERLTHLLRLAVLELLVLHILPHGRRGCGWSLQRSSLCNTVHACEQSASVRCLLDVARKGFEWSAHRFKVLAVGVKQNNLPGGSSDAQRLQLGNAGQAGHHSARCQVHADILAPEHLHCSALLDYL